MNKVQRHLDLLRRIVDAMMPAVLAGDREATAIVIRVLGMEAKILFA